MAVGDFTNFKIDFDNHILNCPVSPFVQEQECFLDELRKAQRKLLKVARDRRFVA